MLVHADGSKRELPAKFDFLRVRAGDRLVFLTAGGGGWGDPLERDPHAVRLDVIRGFVSVEKARDSYGVVVHKETGAADLTATESMRKAERAARPETLPVFDFGENKSRHSVPLTLDHSQSGKL
jgi:N-methylhydantoinase B